MPFGGYKDWDACVSANSDKSDPDAYCGSIKAKTEKSLKKAVGAANHLNQAVRMALKSIVAKVEPPKSMKPRDPNISVHGDKGTEHAHAPSGKPTQYHAHDRGPHNKLLKRDPVKEAGKKKLTDCDGCAADGSQDDQPFAVAFGPDNYDKLTKRIMVAPYREAYQAASAIVKAIERKQMAFPGNLEDHLKKAHAAIHGREMWDERYSDVCDLLKQARKLLHDIEREAEAADQEQQGQEIKQVVGKADPKDTPSKKPVTPQVAPGPELGTTPLGAKPKLKVPLKKIGTGTRGAYDRFAPKKPETFLGKPVGQGTPSSRTGIRPAGWGTPADQRRANQPKNKALRKAVTAAARQAGR